LLAAAVALALLATLAVLTHLAAKDARPLTDRERYYYNGDPTHCIACGRPLRRTGSPDGAVTVIRCPMYGGEGSEHEFYRWADE
jgi:hypothetical protein